MALNLRDFLTALGKDLIRIDDEVDPITQAGALCSAAPRPILLERLRGFPGRPWPSARRRRASSASCPTGCSRACPGNPRSFRTARARR